MTARLSLEVVEPVNPPPHYRLHVDCLPFLCSLYFYEIGVLFFCALCFSLHDVWRLSFADHIYEPSPESA